jgi:transmembrane 9 superfamily member 2/4
LYVFFLQVMTDEEKVEEREETGWKLVHADVFRPPVEMPMLFCVLVGTGMQARLYPEIKPCQTF